MKKLWIEDIENFPAKVYQEDAPDENYLDKTDDIIEWDKATYIMDWSRRRDMIVPAFYYESGSQLQNFSDMSIEKKIISCKYFLIPYSIRVQIVGEDQDKLNWDYLLTQTKASRSTCIESMRKHVGQYIRTGLLTLQQTQTFFLDVSEMIYQFEEANVPNFRKFIFSTDELEGDFEAKEYYSVQLQEELMDIYNGNY